MMARWWLRAPVAFVVAVIAAFIVTAPAAAIAPSSQAVPVARIVEVIPVADRLMRVLVDSPTMGRVEVLVLAGRGPAPRPTLYMLDGRSAYPGGNYWLYQGRAESFFADKPVNVVFTTGGTAGYYTDWQHPDPVLGNYKWETFLTRELPPLIDARFSGNGRNAIAGLSMGAQGAMMLAVRNPTLYRGVAGYSGCYSSTDGPGQEQMRTVVASFGGTADNMFGRPDDPDWAAHDVILHANALRGKAIYLSAGSGLPGRYDTPRTPGVLDTVALGGPIEAIADQCTHQLVDRLTRLGIPATVHFRPTGTHSWPYWADELPASWPVLAGAMEVPASQ